MNEETRALALYFGVLILGGAMLANLDWWLGATPEGFGWGVLAGMAYMFAVSFADAVRAGRD